LRLLHCTYRLIGISGSLPVTTGIKMIEVWILFCLVLSFLDILLQTYVHFLVSTCIFTV
jgi:hypothetical protein